MEIVTGIVRVHAAKTSGECRKRIADASQALGVANNISDTFEAVKKNLESGENFTPETINDVLSGMSERIKSQQADAFKALKSVLGAVSKSLDAIENLPPKEMLEKTRNLFEAVEAFIPKTEDK